MQEGLIPKADIVLRAPTAADTFELLALRSDRELQHTLLAYPPKVYVDDVQEWLGRKLSDPRSVFFIVSDSKNDACLGFVQLSNIHTRGRNADFGIALSKSARGQGVGKRAIELVIEYAAGALALHKIQLEVLSTNDGAIRIYDHMGFREVGTRQEHYYDGSVWCDVLIMEINLEKRSS